MNAPSRALLIATYALSAACLEFADEVPSPSPQCAEAGTDGRPCDDGDPCTAYDSCSSGICRGFALPENAPCDDGNACTSTDACRAGECVGEKLSCGDLDDSCNVGICDPETGECEALPLPEGSVCDDGDPCTAPGTCVVGECLGADAVDCSHLSGPCSAGMCNSDTGGCVRQTLADGLTCDDGDPCTASDTCQSGSCAGTPMVDGSTCDDGNPCTDDDLCIDGLCFAIPTLDGAACDDGLSCTHADTCVDGMCTGGIDLCVCETSADGTGCNDLDPCTENDTCRGGECAGVPKSCAYAGNACNLGVCDSNTGACVTRPVLNGTPCFDDDPCTENDVCANGRCGGQQIDCSEVEDACHTSRCDSSTGNCVAVALGDRTPCDDDNPCTRDEWCQSGTCVDGVEICTACDTLALDDPCDDGSMCTSDDTCVQVEGVLACLGNVADCTDLDGGCNVGACNPSTGVCFAEWAPDTTRCEDSDPCTENDTCNDGTCSGPLVQVCEVEPTICEPFDDNDQVTIATPIDAPAGDEVVVRGRIDTVGEVDWYAVELLRDEGFSAETLADCGSQINTILSLYDTNGVDLLALNDDADGGPFSRIDNFTSTVDGTYYIQVGAYSASGKGTYNLRLLPGGAASCSVPGDCACDQLTCEGQRCVPSIDVEAEPNDRTASATALALDTEIGGRLGATETDIFAVDLTAGMPIEVKTLAFCGESPVDTVLTVYDADGASPLATNDDFDGSVLASIAEVIAPADGTYYVAVRSANFDSGRYRLIVHDRRCLVSADCGCGDQVCSGTEGNRGLCVPALTEAAEVAGSTVRTSTLVGERRHGEIDPAGDVDLFEVRLQPGTYDITTSDYCGARVDTILTVWDRDAKALLAANDDFGESMLSGIDDFPVVITRWVTIGVTARGSAVGPYVVRIVKN